jgi:type IV secretory pathway VirB2 component (pilin)
MSRYRTYLSFAVAFGVAFLMSAVAAHASDTTGGSFSSSANALQGFITGTPTKIISIIAIIIAGLALIFGEDLGVFAKRLLMVVIAIALILGASSLTSAFFSTGALI